MSLHADFMSLQTQACFPRFIPLLSTTGKRGERRKQAAVAQEASLLWLLLFTGHSQLTWPQQCPACPLMPSGSYQHLGEREPLSYFSLSQRTELFFDDNHWQTISNWLCLPSPCQDLAFYANKSPGHITSPVNSRSSSSWALNKLQADRQTDNKDRFPASA